MNARSHFSEAQKNIFRNRAVIGYLYLINLLLAIAMTLPMASNIEALASTAFAKDLIDGFFLDYLPDYWQIYSPAFATAMRFSLSFAALYVIINVFLMGGIFATIAHSATEGIREFLYASATFFGRYFRLFLLALPFLVLFLVSFALGILAPLSSIAESLQPDSANRIYIIALVLGFLLLNAWGMLFDYSKIVLFAQNRKSAFKSFLSATAFVLKNVLKCSRLYLINLTILCLLFISYFALESTIPNTTLLQTFGLFVIQQIFIVARLWMKVSFFASQHHFYTYVPEPKTSGLRELFTSAQRP